LWLLFMLISFYLLWYQKDSGLSEIAVAPFTPYLRLSAPHHALLVFSLGMVVIFLPKLLSVLDLFWDRERRRAFGGIRRAVAGVGAETIFSTLHAPLQMLYHTKFVIITLLGIEVRWGQQQRAAAGTPWATAARQHCIHTTIGLGWGIFAWRLGGEVFWWFLPVCAGLLLSVPLTVLSSRDDLGRALRLAGLLLTPEETAPPTQLTRLNARLLARRPKYANDGDALLEAIRDPYLNATHVSILCDHGSSPRESRSSAVTDLVEKALTSGPENLSAAEQEILASSAYSMAHLHQRHWLSLGEKRDST
jgi:membrane glycosyltransferase